MREIIDDECVEHTAKGDERADGHGCAGVCAYIAREFKQRADAYAFRSRDAKLRLSAVATGESNRGCAARFV